MSGSSRVVDPAASLFDPRFMPEGRPCPGPDTAVVDLPRFGVTAYQRRGLPPDVAQWCTAFFSCSLGSIPTGFTVQLIATGSTLIWFQHQDHAVSQGRIRVSGCWTHAPKVPLAGVAGLDCLRLRPGAFFALFGVPAQEFGNRHVDLADLLPDEGSGLLQRMLDQGSGELRYQTLLGWIRTRISARARSKDLQLVDGLRRWIAEPGTLDGIAHHTGTSQRQLQRWFGERVGMTPSAFHQLWQIRQVLIATLGEEDPDWRRLALQHGFADQAHLTRRWKQILGTSPERYHRRWRDGGAWLDGFVLLPTSRMQ